MTQENPIVNKAEITEWYKRAQKKVREGCDFCGKCEDCADYIMANEMYIWEVEGGGPMFTTPQAPEPGKRIVSEFDDLFPPRPNDSGRY